MSVSSQETIFHHEGNGVTVTFAFGCKVLQYSDLNVYLEDVQVTNGITVEGIGSPTGGTVTFDVAPANLAAVRLEREVELERLTDYQQNGDFLSRVVNPDFDRIWMALQQTAAGFNRTLRAPNSDVVGPLPLPTIANRANYLLGFDASGNPIAIALAAQSATALQAALAQPAGAAMVGFRQTTVDERLKDSISIQDYGGKDDFGVAVPTDNAAAFAIITALYPAGTTIRFPRTNTGTYRFTTYAGGGYNNFVYDVDEGVVLRFPSNAITGQYLARFVRDTVCYFTDLNAFYTMKASFSNTNQARYHLHKTQFMGPGDRDTTLASPVDLSVGGVEKFDCAWPDGPFTTSATIATPSARKADISLAAANAGMKIIAVPVIPGAEYSCWLESPVGWDGFYMFGVATQNGYDVLYESMIPGTGASRMQKEFGSGSVNSNVTYLGSGDHYSTWAKNGICTVRVLANNSFVVLVDGVERYRSRATVSAIRSVIFGAGFGTLAATVSVRDLVLLKHKETAGQMPIDVMAMGDSITDAAIHGNWPNYAAEALEGTMGIRVHRMINIAVSGAKMSDQYASLLTADISQIKLALIMVGVNDIQAQTDQVADFIFNLARILDHFNNAGIPCVVGMPTKFYSQALGFSKTGFAAQGQNALNYEKGGGYRGRLLYEVASRNPTMNRICYGTLEELGPVLANWLVDAEGVDPIMYDNIHPTSHARRLIGYAMARSAAGLLAPKLLRSYPLTNFQPTWMLSSWTTATARFDISEVGELGLVGLINKNAGSIADGTEVFQLPPFLRPITPLQVSCLVTGAAFNAVVRLLIDSATGKGSIYGAPVGTTGIYLEPMRYRLDW